MTAVLLILALDLAMLAHLWHRATVEAQLTVIWTDLRCIALVVEKNAANARAAEAHKVADAAVETARLAWRYVSTRALAEVSG